MEAGLFERGEGMASGSMCEGGRATCHTESYIAKSEFGGAAVAGSIALPAAGESWMEAFAPLADVCDPPRAGEERNVS